MKMFMQKVLVMSVAVWLLAGGVSAQIASGGSYSLDQSVIANGGGTSAGGNLKVEGTAGQTVAGQKATTSPFSAHAGFWNAAPLSPTAASVSISGRVQTADGQGIRNARVTLSSADGTVRMAITGSFGNFCFDEIPAGETYIANVSAKRFQFVEPTRVVTVLDQLSDLMFVALQN